ncbi:MAG: M3 family metallopeptidase [Bacteroidetes bacterium]|nr:M3 family metallopeptidase [Bacteroidota bacterium]
MNINPLLTNWNFPHQTAPFNEIKVEHYLPAIEISIRDAKKEIDAIITNSEKPTFQNTLEALELAGAKLSEIASLLYNQNSAETCDELQAVARDASPKLTEYSNYISLNEQLFKKIKTVYDERENLTLTPEQIYLLEHTYKNFVRRGAALTGNDKKKYAEISTELAKLSLKFGENVLAETNAFSLLVTDEKNLSGLPEGVIEAAAQLAKSKEKEGWMFNLQFPSYYPFLQFADNRKLREEIYRASGSRAFKNNEFNNEEIIKQIVSLRLEMAKLLGFVNYAQYVLEERMAQTPEKVNDFIQDLHKYSRPVADKEYAEVEKLARKEGFHDAVERWDWAYYTEKLKAEKYGFNEEEVKPYFQLEKVQDGVFELAKRLYGLSFKENRAVQVYHQDVSAYEVYDEDGSFLSVLYLDFFPREGKRHGAWSSDYRPQSNVNGNPIRPIITVVCNFTKPTKSKPSLLNFREVETFLHEFGHALHGMLSNTSYPSLSGTNVFWDFVELPSQMMENWASQKEWLDLFAVHYKTGEKIPDDLIQKLIKSKNFLAGYASDRQISLGMTDMAWHTITEPVNAKVYDFEKNAMSDTELFPKIEETCTSTAFSHIFGGGYAAGYYSYKWAEVLDADAFAAFKEKGIFDKATATSFRKNILEKGGTQHPMELYINFRGHEPMVDALLERSGLK